MVPLVMALAYVVLLLGVSSLVISQVASTTANPFGIFAGIMPRPAQPNPALVTRLPTATKTASQHAVRVMRRMASEDTLLDSGLGFSGVHDSAKAAGGGSAGRAKGGANGGAKQGAKGGANADAKGRAKGGAWAKGGANVGATDVGRVPHAEEHAMRVAASLGTSFWDKPENRQPLPRAAAKAAEKAEAGGAAADSGQDRLHRKVPGPPKRAGGEETVDLGSRPGSQAGPGRVAEAHAEVQSSSGGPHAASD
ncbi:hypothetical protein HYH03_013202 [Edaphochlamys debaryana]|uniref:Uncharacterized protein n=1 Tax=Edaphochlamys debaryana TaxID=47281 RepID=A0A835XQ61_9CHLO|nr:hypothetical protein HYH03_013202 [Edaphochlamys debaryana]|eukprot:KAG2488208.1 hypothetical protein HYH03_013202 [Edaphochlamys debaryana]